MKGKKQSVSTMKATCVDQYGNKQLIRLPYSKATLLNYSLLELDHQERFVLMHVLSGVSLKAIGQRMKGVPDGYGHKRTKNVSAGRVAQIRNEALVKLREALPFNVRLNLTEIETLMITIRSTAAHWKAKDDELNKEDKPDEEAT